MHLYSGLLLAPWAAFFGLSALLFNHPNVGESGSTRHMNQAQLEQLTSLEPRHPEPSAEAVVAAMRDAGLGAYTVDPAFTPYFEGPALLTAPGDGVQYTALVDLARGDAEIRTAPHHEGISAAPFAGVELSPLGLRSSDVQAQLESLLSELDLEAQHPLEAHPRRTPSLEFRAIDAAGTTWNVVYDLGSGELSGRRAAGPSGHRVKRIIAGLHTTHHFPARKGARFAWVLIADVTALVLIYWALSGLLMWTQLKRFRRVGAILIAVSLGAAVVVFAGTIGDLTFEGNASTGRG